jgi:multidrug efflux pump subunit AcrA (membrane-fusion protein)
VFQLAQDVLLRLSLLTLSAVFCQVPSIAAVPGTTTIGLESRLRPTGYPSKSPNAKSQGDVAVISADGLIELSDDKPFHVHAMLSGRISQDNAVIGKYFRKGELLALMESAELVNLSADYLMRLGQNEMSIQQRESSGRLARASLERIQMLVKEGIMADKELEKAEEDVRTAVEDLKDLNEQRIRLENESNTLATMYGIKSLNVKQETAPSELPIRAPNSGVVVIKNVTLGDRVNPDQAAYVMAGVSKVRLRIVLPIADRERIALGQHVNFLCNKISMKSFSGSIDSITAPKDSLSQDFSVSLILENPQALLRPGMIGQAKMFVK